MGRRKKPAAAWWVVVLVAATWPAVTAQATPRSAALYARGLVAFNASRWEQAYHLFDEAVHADPSDATAVYYRGLAQGRRGQPAAAIKDIEEALKLNPAQPHAALDLGIAYFDTGQYGSAKSLLERAYQQGSERSVAAFFLGLALYRLGDQAQALVYLNEAESDPEVRASAHYYAGLVLRHQGQADAARNEFAQAAQEQPESDVGKAAQQYATGAPAPVPPAPGRGKPWSVYAKLGFAYDTNVVAGPSEADARGQAGISGEGDGFTALGAGGQYTLLDSDVGSVRASYDFYQSIHFQLTQFDLQGHRVRVDAASRPGPLSYGLSGTYDFYALDYQTFYQEGLGTPWVAVAEGKTAATQLYYTLRGRDFFRQPFNPGRDGIDNAVGLRQFALLGNAARVLSGGVQFDSEDTVSNGPQGDQFEYNGYQADVGLALPILDIVRLQLAYLVRIENYQFVNQFPNGDGSFVRRHDFQQQFVLNAAHDLSEHVTVTFDFLGVISGSNIPNFSYDRDIVGAGLQTRF